MKSLLLNSFFLVLLMAAFFHSPDPVLAETFRGVVIDVDEEQGQVTVTPQQNTSAHPSPVVVKLPKEDASHGQCNRVPLQYLCKGKQIFISGTFSTQQPDLFVATRIFQGNKAHFKDGTGVRLRLGRCRHLENNDGCQPSF
jgi:hypothetical protein